jgi:hypothetical protein
MSDAGLVRSDRCGLDELFLAHGTGDAERGRLALDPGWPRRWTAEWRSEGGEVACAAGDLDSVPLDGCKPVRRFSWRRRCFAAAAEAALEAGWQYLVVAGWRPHVLAAVDAMSAQRRDLDDQLGLQDCLLRAVSAGPAAFGDLVAATPLPAVARAHALHLLWRRRLGVDLSRPLGDTSLVWLAAERG